jgi:hypothetical protein
VTESSLVIWAWLSCRAIRSNGWHVVLVLWMSKVTLVFFATESIFLVVLANAHLFFDICVQERTLLITVATGALEIVNTYLLLCFALISLDINRPFNINNFFDSFLSKSIVVYKLIGHIIMVLHVSAVVTVSLVVIRLLSKPCIHVCSLPFLRIIITSILIVLASIKVAGVVISILPLRKVAVVPPLVWSIISPVVVVVIVHLTKFKGF